MYDHYIAVDWAKANMAVARLTSKTENLKEYEGPADLDGLKEQLKTLRGTKVLTIEETTTSQWLYTELKPFVDRLLVCDPHRNRLLSEGPKTDRIDAQKLVKLLKADLLKEVFHSGDELIYLRRVVSGYIDIVKSGVRMKNQMSALERANTQTEADAFVLGGLERSIAAYEVEKKRYEQEFARLAKKHKSIRVLKTIPGIGDIHAVKIVSRVVDGKRFPSKGHFLSYCGLVVHQRMSGGNNYGQKRPRYCRILKEVFKMAAATVLQEKSKTEFREHYEYLIREKNYAEHNARHAVARHLAVVTLGVLKAETKFKSRPK